MASTRQTTVAAERKLQASRLYLQGMTQTQVARKLGVNVSQISRYLAQVRKEWLEERLSNFEQHQADELARIAEVERQAWQAFERSQKDAESVETTKDDAGKSTGTKTRRTRQVGNPKFLDIVLKCSQDRCKILGLTAQKDEEPNTEEVQEQDARVCEIVVENREDVPKVLKFSDFEDAQAATN